MRVTGQTTPEAGADDFGTRAYNNFWVSPGSNLALIKGEFRTSYIVDPPSGRIPRREDPQYDFERANFGNRYATGVADYSGPEAFPTRSVASWDLETRPAQA